jgi:hypothetical protein
MNRKLSFQQKIETQTMGNLNVKMDVEIVNEDLVPEDDRIKEALDSAIKHLCKEKLSN